MKRSLGLLNLFALLYGLMTAAVPALLAQNAQHLAFAGLRAVAGRGQFNAVKSDAAGELYLLLDQKDGVRVLKMDANATEVLAEAHLGAQGDIGVALALDPAGNVYVTGTTAS
ncbi:MAG TPA: SBBP repeat-containing protein, partial [Edaphobacter sp.]|nr:SBBP repeat-containing protein [Edaphobacter sp.]